jgi:hypothetical protein
LTDRGWKKSEAFVMQRLLKNERKLKEVRGMIRNDSEIIGNIRKEIEDLFRLMLNAFYPFKK